MLIREVELKYRHKSPYLWISNFDKVVNNKHQRKDSIFNNWCQSHLIHRRIQITHIFILHKTQPQKDQVHQRKTGCYKSDRRKRENRLELIGTGKEFLSRIPIILQAPRPIVNKWDLMKMKHSFMTNSTAIWAKWQLQSGKIFLPSRGLVSKIYKEF